MKKILALTIITFLTSSLINIPENFNKEISFFSSAYAKNDDNLKSKIEKVISGKRAVIGVSIYGFEDNFYIGINDKKHLPMQSVFKFHVSLAVLNEIDKGKLALNQKISIKKSDLTPNIWSPLRDRYPKGVTLPISEIIRYTMQESDNIGCDVLLKLIGGPKKVNDYIHQIGIKDVAIKLTEKEMQTGEWSAQYLNWTTSEASNELLKTFYKRKILSQKSYDFLWKTMLGTKTGTKRIKEKLPKGSLTAHKTGTSGISSKGITGAVNDIGIVTLPNGKHFAISVFVTDSKENAAINEKIISDISKLAADYFMKK